MMKSDEFWEETASSLSSGALCSKNTTKGGLVGGLDEKLDKKVQLSSTHTHKEVLISSAS